ncbi:DEAD/DEAH box helicase [Dehalobacterium formicoaceticum]|jgi:type III restriction enzyme|uniref:DEAD/DEAH box helicase family protein n=1 Tax=Dehalobacterium formicoaceticum TaxID=51515 RepID=A0ABT1Y7Q1_9FIRM|nr:DEAD/DEAH box helicase family protein [Dehalobacterium formicoaceticum]MCR6546115.1 DEAD/DEAH box helicase family protein [Dehalobacterium formicoaceticum]MDD3645172.1 DEAD/DEAH box helicase family protein [Bacteroidales bacterium]
MEGIIRNNASDLTLKVRSSYDVKKLNLTEWEDYLDILCGNRDYQKKAIKTAIIYLASGEYANIDQLARENYKNNQDLQKLYRTEHDFIQRIPLKGKLSGVIDLATATGKSYVIYGIAQIMLSLGLVTKVLVLCPSLTIESGLMEKFIEKASDARLKASIPETAFFKNPRIIDANSTIKDGDICVENIHAVYDGTGSSIIDSLKGCGEKTLVLSDEVHHAYNSSGENDIRKWKTFLMNEDFQFKYLLGFTGTAYIENEYFSDVIYRFSLREAMERSFVKLVEYVAEDESGDQYEKFQKIYDNHKEFQKKYGDIKPITIMVTKDIKSAGYLYEDFLDFIEKKEGILRDEFEDKVLIVTSAPKHKKNVIALKTVDDKSNPAEWIISVSMLTEGWDVKNVFQIVPWEDRAFNSKLLIAQVLGRGLRIPENTSGQPKVRVFNHASWSKSIQSLVDEVLEKEMTVSSKIVSLPDKNKYNFEVYTINYAKKERTIEKKDTKTQEVFDLTNGIKLVSQSEKEPKKTTYEDIKGHLHSKSTIIQKELISIDEVINKIIESFKGRALEAKLIFPSGEYEQEKLPSIQDIRTFIEKSMRDIGENGSFLTLENADKIYGRFNGLLRKKPTTPVLEKAVDILVSLNTADMKSETSRYGTLIRDVSLFFSDNYKNEIEEDELPIFEAVRQELKKRQDNEINRYNFKTPVNVVFTTLEPEKKFVELLTSDDFAQHIDAWIKSRDKGFYSIDYQKNKGSKFKAFNPDFFIKKNNNVIVVEIKSDNDDSPENKAKNRAAKRHFEILNAELEKHGKPDRYYFTFLSPVDYNTFADNVKDGRIFESKFRSHLEILLEESGDE